VPSDRRDGCARPDRKHLRRLDRIYVPGAPVFFLSVCVRDRRSVLARPETARIVSDALETSLDAHGWMVGRYVTMPDHMHFFATPIGDSARSLSGFLRYWKSTTTKRMRAAGVAGFAWQREFFDHLLRSKESYRQKWDYVRLNPVRARLVSDPSEWPYQGEVHVI